jgi:hypothetical protein
MMIECQMPRERVVPLASEEAFPLLRWRKQMPAASCNDDQRFASPTAAVRHTSVRAPLKPR